MRCCKLLPIVGLILIHFLPVNAQTTTIQQIANYQDWGWDAVVMENGLITVATVPVIGARIMQYDLGSHPSIFVYADELGNTYTPAANSQWPNFGGFKNWPAPQERWNWPPPPIIDFGLYEATIAADTPDSVALFVRGGVEKWRTPNLRFERRTTIFKYSSRVRVKQTLINEGTAAADWSVWDITQAIVNHPGEKDYKNFWAYFPINPDSRYGSTGVRKGGSSSAWKGEVAPGIYGVQFSPDGQKIFADSHEGWVAYVDEKDGYAYVKVFHIWPDADYPDDGAHVEVWVNNNPAYMEVEVVSPIAELAANGGAYTFVEDWYAAKMNGPVLAANHAGAVAKHLSRSGGALTGTYGIFHTGYAELAFVDASDNVLSQGAPVVVMPQSTFEYSENIAIPAGADRAELRLFDTGGGFVGVVESMRIADMTGVEGDRRDQPSGFLLRQNYPNPFNPTTVIPYQVAQPGQVLLSIYDVNGREVQRLMSQHLAAGQYKTVWDASAYPAGVYVCSMQAGAETHLIKLLLLK